MQEAAPNVVTGKATTRARCEPSTTWYKFVLIWFVKIYTSFSTVCIFARPKERGKYPAIETLYHIL